MPSRVAHSLVWIRPDCHGIVALLVISGKQPSSELLHTLRFICVCWPPKRQCSISTSYPQHGSTSCLPGNFLACVTISTNVDDTASNHRARVSHNIYDTFYSYNLRGLGRDKFVAFARYPHTICVSNPIPLPMTLVGFLTAIIYSRLALQRRQMPPCHSISPHLTQIAPEKR